MLLTTAGMAIGDGLCDPATMTDYGDFLYSVGLVDEVQRDQFRVKQQVIQSLIDHQLWTRAFQVRTATVILFSITMACSKQVRTRNMFMK